MKQVSTDPRRLRREGVRSSLVILLIAATTRAFLVQTAVQREHAFKPSTSVTSTALPAAASVGTTAWRGKKRRTPPSSCYCSGSPEGGFCAGNSLAGASGLSATLSAGDAATRAEALTGFFAAFVSAATVLAVDAPGANSDGLGVVDDLLADCPSTPTCVSSQDDRPYAFMEPWAYEGPFERSMSRLRAYLESSGAKVIASSPRYLRVEFDAPKAFPSSVDDAEFYFTPGDALVQFRCARRNGPTDFGANRKRMDSIRIALKFESIPVLRNRKRTFFFGESPIDSFGPSFGKVDPSVIYGDIDPMSPPFETPSEALRERYGGGDGRSDRPAWWGKPLAEAGGFSDWRQSQSPAA